MNNLSRNYDLLNFNWWVLWFCVVQPNLNPRAPRDLEVYDILTSMVNNL